MLDLNQKTVYNSLNFKALAGVCNACHKCDLHLTRTNVVVGHGPVPSDIMVIGEGPGEKEDLEGKPFIGKSGKLLTKLFESAGINRDTDVFIANTVKCRPPKNRNPLLSEIEQCKPYLIRQIQLVKPKILILLGAPSLKTILKSKETITHMRGEWVSVDVDYMKEPLYVMAMFHPSYLLRFASQKEGSPRWLTWHDMKEVKDVLDFYGE